MKRTIILLSILLIAHCSLLIAQSPDSIVTKNFFDQALISKTSYKNLEYLCKHIGGRLTGSPQAAAAVEYTKQIMDNMGLDNVFLQEVNVPVWNRGAKEFANISSVTLGSQNLNVCALGGSVGTGSAGIFANVIEVKSFKALDSLANVKPANSKLPKINLVKGKIVFFNRPADQTKFNTFEAYGGAVDQRAVGASVAAKYGAVGVIVRSSTVSDENNPHTGIMHYKDSITRIPAIGVSNTHADLLDDWLAKDNKLVLFFRTECGYAKDTKSYNVIGEIKGSEHPDEFISVGGHLDSWDLGEAAHDDGAGVVQSIEVLRLFKQLNIKPKHTIRAVLFMDEEIAQSGGKAYLANAQKLNEKHIAAIESDRGGTTPTGISIDADNKAYDKIQGWTPLFHKYGMYEFFKGGSGVDVGPLKKINIPLFGLITDSQRYFDFHHSANDKFENVSRRELQLGAAAMASFIYLIDKYGL